MERYDESGLRLAYARAGADGDPVAFVHGALDDHRVWHGVVPGLSPSLQTLVYDRRGHGGSSGPPRLRPVEDDAADLARLLERTGLYPAHLVAADYGAGVALRLAGERPELVRSVAVHEPLFLRLSGEADDRGAELARRADGRSPDDGARSFLDRYGGEADRWETLPLAWREEFAGNAATLPEELADPEATGSGPAGLGEIAVPVLVTVGESSPEPARRLAETLGQRLGNGRALVIPGAGLLAPRANPERYGAVVGTFLLERNVPTT